MWSRRDFLSWSAVTVLSQAMIKAQSTQPTTTPSTQPGRKVLHIIGHSHIDAAWLWPWRDGSDLALSTIRSALDRMNETPGFRYIHSSAIHYRWLAKADPAMLEEVRRRIAEGRWEVVGGWPVEPDCNLPSGESFVRHCLYGKSFLKDLLGVDVRVGFNPDAFGHAAGLPTILHGAGYRYYAFQRPGDRENTLPLLFWWEGPDGSRLLTQRIYGSYDGATFKLPDAAENGFAPGFDHAAFYLGVGDHGGAVTKQQIAELIKLRDNPDLPELRWSTLSEYFAAIEQSPAFATLPVVKGELQHHARGCYSANGDVKIQNRRGERMLAVAETTSLIAHATIGRPYAADALRDAWWKVLFNQFHDLLAGSALFENYTAARDGIGYACEIAATEKQQSLQAMAKRVNLTGTVESAVFLFNPLPWKRRTWVDIYIKKVPKAEPPISHLLAQDGSTVPIQFRASRSMIGSYPRLTAWVDLPACGYKVFDLARGGDLPATPIISQATIAEKSLGITALRVDNTELLAGPVSLVVISDKSDTWGHNIAEFRTEIGRPTFISLEVIADGPVSRVTRQVAKWNDSEIILEITQHAAIDAIELHFIIDWREREQILKLEVPTALANPRAFAKVPAAIVERATNGEEQPCQDWVAVQGSAGGGGGSADHTVALLNAGSYSYDCKDGLLRMILIRSAAFARDGGGPKVDPTTIHDGNAWQDQGRQERTFWLVAGQGPIESLALDRLADSLQTPAEYVMDSAHAGTEPREKSLLDVAPAGVAVMAVKRAEADDRWIVRLQESGGKNARCTISSAALGLSGVVELAANQLKTLHISTTLTAGAVAETNVMEVK